MVPIIFGRFFPGHGWFTVGNVYESGILNKRLCFFLRDKSFYSYYMQKNVDIKLTGNN